MKKVYQLIATATLSLIAVGAFAQNMTKTVVTSKTHKKAVAPAFNHAAKKPMGATTYAFLDYPLSDSVISSQFGNSYLGSPLTGGFYIQQANMHYVTSDSGADGQNGQPLNDALLRYVSVAFDTLIDANSQTGYSGSNVVVDSLIIPIGQENLSGQNDTLIVQINAVGKYGIPTTTSFLWDTVIVTKTGLSGNTRNSWLGGYNLMLAPHKALVGTSKFAVTLKYYDQSKQDTFGFLYGSPSYNCVAAGGAYPDTTYIGAVIPFTNPAGKVMANSFSNGWEYFYGSPTFTGPALTLPNTTYGAFLQYGCGTSNSIGIGWQDIVIYAEVSFTDVTGINNVTSNGLSIGQNYPNPFNKTTQISYSVTKSSDVVFSVYDMQGRKLVANTYSEVAPGQHTISLGANQFTPGVYFYTFNVNGNVVTKKMVITE